MRLLTHNTLRNNCADAKGKGFPLKINAVEVKVEETTEVTDQNIAFVKNILSRIDWESLVKAASEMGIPTLPPVLTEEMAENDDFMKALYHILMNVRLINGMLTCPVTGREFPVTDGVANMMIEEEECENARV